MENMNFCQSCAMPINSEECLGTNKNGSKNKDYCSYCFQNGSFTTDISMDEMINLCVEPMVEHNKNMNEEEAIKIMKDPFPNLKRWKK